MLSQGVSVPQFCYVTLCTSNIETEIPRQFISIPQFNRATRSTSPVVRFSWRCSWILRSSSVPKGQSRSNSRIALAFWSLTKFNYCLSTINSSSFDRICWIGLPLRRSILHMKIIKSRYRSRMTDEHLKYCLHFCLSNHSFSKSSQDM